MFVVKFLAVSVVIDNEFVDLFEFLLAQLLMMLGLLPDDLDLLLPFVLDLRHLLRLLLQQLLRPLLHHLPLLLSTLLALKVTLEAFLLSLHLSHQSFLRSRINFRE